jgi:hypothetical protein
VTNTWENNLKKEGVYLAHGFRGFSSWSAGSIAMGLWWGEHHGDWSVRQRRPLTSWCLESREGTKRGRWHVPSKKWPRDPCLPIRPCHPQFPPPPYRPSNCESINGFIHWLGQNSHDSVCFPKALCLHITLGTKPSTHEPSEKVSYQTTTDKKSYYNLWLKAMRIVNVKTRR